MKPTPAETLNGMSRIQRATTPPTMAKGTFKKMSAAGTTARNASQRRNPIKLNALIGAGINDVKLDSALSTKDIFRIGKQFKSLEPESVDMLTLPADNYRTNAGAAA